MVFWERSRPNLVRIILLLHQLSPYIVAVPFPDPGDTDLPVNAPTPSINELIYEDVENGCFCRIDVQLLTSCYGQDCKQLPRNVYIYNRRLRVSGTAIQSLSPGDFVGYEDLIELQVTIVSISLEIPVEILFYSI